MTDPDGRFRARVPPGTEVAIVLKADQPSGCVSRFLVLSLLAYAALRSNDASLWLCACECARLQFRLSDVHQISCSTLGTTPSELTSIL